MIFNTVIKGGGGSEPFVFTYFGNLTDSRIDGIGDVTFNTNGTMQVLSGKATVSVYILGAGGGGAKTAGASARGGGGGQQTVEVELTPGTYEIIIGKGGTGAGFSGITGMTGGIGGNTSAFGYTSTGGKGGYALRTGTPGEGGTPDGITGGGNGGTANSYDAVDNTGGDGLVRITIS